MFKVGDKVVYPHHGAAVVERRESKEAFGEKREYLVLRLAYGDLTLMVPADNTDGVGLREVINDEEVEEVFAVLRKKEARMPTNWSRRYKNHSEKLRSGDIYQVAEVVRNLSIRDKDKGLSAGEKRMLGRARQILVSELTFALGVDEEAAEQRLERGAALTAHRSRPSSGPVVVAAGSGTRFGGPKQFAILGGRPVARWSVEACRSVADGVVVVVPPRSGRGPARPRCRRRRARRERPGRPPSGRASRRFPRRPGRSSCTTRRGPWPRRRCSRAVVGALEAGAAGAVCALPVSDTSRRSTEANPAGPRPCAGPSTARGWSRCRPPRGSRVEVLRAAHRGEPEATDDAALVEALGAAVVGGARRSGQLKLTSPTDLAYAEFLLARNS